jgi:hypothetical protein
MRKIYAAMVTGVLILCLWGCGNGKNAETSVKELQKTNAAGTAFVSLDNASAALGSGVQDAAGERPLK